MNEHHIWCNVQQGLVEKCRQCVGLYKLYPMIDGDDGTELAKLHFPNAIPIPKFPRKEIEHA
jgi:hypothetical protein